MTHPDTLDHMPLDQLVANARDEIRRLCLGGNHVGGRRWTMCVPAQADDSDIVMVATITRLAAEASRLQQLLYSTTESLGEATTGRDRAKASADAMHSHLRHAWNQLGAERSNRHSAIGDAIAEVQAELANAKAELEEVAVTISKALKLGDENIAKQAEIGRAVDGLIAERNALAAKLADTRGWVQEHVHEAAIARADAAEAKLATAIGCLDTEAETMRRVDEAEVRADAAERDVDFQRNRAESWQAKAAKLAEALTILVPILEQWHEEFPQDVGDKEAPALAIVRAALAVPKDGG